MTAVASAAGLLSLLDEDDVAVKGFALDKLNASVNDLWAEIADALEKVELLYEDEHFKHRQLAALLASKVYYHLGGYDESVNFALGAGSQFDLMSKSEYVETIIANCIDRYIDMRVKKSESHDVVDIDSRLEAIVDRMFQRCFQDGQFKQAVGIALETRRLDVFREAIVQSSDVLGMLQYAIDICMTVIQNRAFRNMVLRIIVDLHRSVPEPDFEAMCRCLVFLNDAEAVAAILTEHLLGEEALRVYQLCFDLYENATQEFLRVVVDHLPKSTEEKPLAPELIEQIKKVETILSGEVSIALHLEFLFRNNKTDLAILKATKTAVESRVSMTHSATVFANAIMHAGTTSDQFLRENLDWLARATNWAKFSATASLGLIHKGNISNALTLLAPYLPQRSGATTSFYSEGGSLFALGLIHANHGKGIVPYLLEALKNSPNEIVQHGACLGLGVAAMATGDNEVFEALKAVLYSDSAVAGEAAGLAMGFVMLGTGSENATKEMLQYAQETQHEKIIRGLAIGIALVCYRLEEEAEALIEQLTRDKDPILRYGAMFVIAMAYAGTGHNGAVRRLLHVAVSDVNDDVRRASVIALGFLLFRTPEQCPRMVQLLAESYNPHVRYGATLALGISCAGTGLSQAVDLLEPMTNDPVDFVRQGALMALAMVYIQHNEVMSPRVTKIRKLYEKIIGDKHEDTMAKFGAILAQGILDAGGRNVTISLQSRAGHARMSAIVGMMMFTQFWYWFPLVNTISLALTPTATIFLNKDLKMPKFEFISNIKPSAFAYPPMTPPPTGEKVNKVTTAILSTTARAKARAQHKEKEKAKEEAMEVDGKSAAAPAAEQMDVDTTAAEKPAEAKETKEKKAPKVVEPSFEMLQNPARVLPAQQKHISFAKDARYVPIKKSELIGIVMLRDTKPDEPEDLIATTTGPAAPTATTSSAQSASASSSGSASTTTAAPPASQGAEEPAPPEEFDFNG